MKTEQEQKWEAFRASLGNLTAADSLTPMQRGHREQTDKQKRGQERTRKWRSKYANKSEP